MSSIVTSTARAGGLPRESGYMHGFELLTGATMAAALAAMLVPPTVRSLSRPRRAEPVPHAELGLLATGRLAGSEPE